ncbi:unnamed protein product [Rotaria sp. Silwood1]|nr:unnamed protein product [Rotaria sp. Silwood1]
MLIKESYKVLHGTQLVEGLMNSRIHKTCYWKYYRHARKPLADVTNHHSSSSISNTFTNTGSTINAVINTSNGINVDILPSLSATQVSSDIQSSATESCETIFQQNYSNQLDISVETTSPLFITLSSLSEEINDKDRSSRSVGRSAGVKKSADQLTSSLTNNMKFCLYQNSFDELCGWLKNLLQSGLLISMINVQEKYRELLRSRNETITESILRTTSIRDRLKTKFGEKILFTKTNKSQGVYVCWNSMSEITHSILTNNTVLDYDDAIESNRIYKTRNICEDKQPLCEKLIEAIGLLREAMQENLHYLKKVQQNHESLAQITSDLFWDCASLIIKNFIGLLTSAERDFQSFRKDYQFYKLYDEDIFKSSEKSLKISSIVYDIIGARYSHFVTHKHILLGNEIFHHVRSSHLLNIMNRFGHTCSYETMVRLQKKAADAIASLSPTALPPSVKQEHSFAIAIVDNFDLNIGTLHGENSIHILNRIIIQTPNPEELLCDVNQCLVDLCSRVAAAIENTDHDATHSDHVQDTTRSTAQIINKMEYKPYKDNSYDAILLSYSLMKYAFDQSNDLTKIIDSHMQINLPLLSGFLASFIENMQRPLSKITFLPPINQDPSSLSASKLCMASIKTALIDSGFQKEVVIVADEKIYSQCIKVKRDNNIDNNMIFVYAGDFHIMKNYLIVIWDVLNGSGIEDIFACIYKGAAHRAAMNVHNFNSSLRCCKLLYSALSILFIESFIKTSLSSSSTAIAVDKLKQILEAVPSDYATNKEKQSWFVSLVDEIKNIQLLDIINQWASEQCEKNLVFKFWYFVYRQLLEPLILLYMSVRLSNFNGRNAALSLMGPIFFSTNHRNYARLVVQHLLDLQSASSYLRENLEKFFTVNRSNRPFSAIALDQAIECSINKYGKGRGTIVEIFF